MHSTPTRCQRSGISLVAIWTELGILGSMLPTQLQTYTFPLVAQIDFPPAGIMEGEDPMNSTKLARRDVVWISN
jgi:hypothetical protein